MGDEAGLQRFVDAQDDGGTYDRALAELRAGRKQSHWVWFVLPQLAGLGRSETSRRYGLRDLAEARAYLAHPVLGPRLATCLQALLALPTREPERVLGAVDAQKLHSCVTLFTAADPGDPLPAEVLAAYFGAAADPGTTRLLQGA